MDIFSFLRRKNIKQADLSRLLKTVPGNVTRWVKEEGVPSYELCGKLLSLGMTVEELWGIEYKGGGPKPPDTPELRAGQQHALKDIEATIAARVKNEILTDLKNKGVI